MSIKGKLVKYTVAASVMATSFAGIPLSDKGLFEKFGSPSAYAAEAAPAFLNAQALELLNKLNTALTAQGKADLQAAKDAFAALSIGKKRATVAPITSKIAAKIDLSDEQEGVLEDLIADLTAVQYDATGADLEAIRTNEEYRKVLVIIAKSAGVATDTSLDSVVSSIVSYNTTIKTRLLSMTTASLLELASSAAKQNEFLETAVNEVLAKAPISTFVTYYGINSDDVNQVRKNVRDAIGATKYNNAVNALGKAYIAAFATENSNNYTGGGYVATDSLSSQLDALKAKLAGATDAERLELAKKAIDLALAELAKWNSFDASKYVKSVDGKATADLGSELLNNLKESQAIFDKLNDFLKEAKVDVKAPAVKFSINLGDVKDASVLTKVSAEAMKAWSASDYSAINVVIGGLTVSLPDAPEYATDLALSVGIADASSEDAVKGYKTLSSVYNFDLSLGGKQVSEFSNPISVAIPLNSTTGVDNELLSVARITNGQLEFVGGNVVGNTIVEPRDHFSSYVVVENKVKFSDTASVQAWAGRQIEVLAAKGAIQGRGAGKFDPKGNVTRAEFAKMLISAFNLESAGNKVTFNDVNANAWYAPYVASAAKLGIINGRSATTFAPNATITRAEMATMIARAVQSIQGSVTVDADAALAAFSDAGSINATLKAGVAFAADKGLIIGNNGKFLPQNNASRAEAAVILYRAINLK